MWWAHVFPKTSPFISLQVLQELERGDRIAAQKRLQIAKRISLLGNKPEIEELALAFLKKVNIPTRAKMDAFHIACASIHRMDYLLTWNCTHIANASLRKVIDSVNKQYGYKTPVICTPEELLEIQNAKEKF